MACEDMEYLGVEFDAEVNATCPRGDRAVLTKPESKVKVVIIPTDEEYMIALDTQKIANA
jgi:acetate kinase